jgi:hypothetical protein
MEVVVGETGYGKSFPPVKRILAVNRVIDGDTKST